MARHPKRIRIYTTGWYLAGSFLLVILPLAALFAVAGITHVTLKTLFADTVTSLARMAIAYVVAAVLGWVCAILFYRGKVATVALPVFDVLQSFPTSAALPLATYFWGRTDATVILFLSVQIVWPIFFSIVSALRLMKHDWEESAEIVGLAGVDYVRLFLLPVSIPGLMTGSIIGLGDAWESLVATEIIVNIRQGLGTFFQRFSQDFFVTGVGILGFLLLIFSINKLIWLPLLDWSHRLMEE